MSKAYAAGYKFHIRPGRLVYGLQGAASYMYDTQMLARGPYRGGADDFFRYGIVIARVERTPRMPGDNVVDALYVLDSTNGRLGWVHLETVDVVP